MSADNDLELMLSPNPHKFVRERVASGEYASDSDVLNDRVAALKSETDRRDRWEKDVLIPTYKRMMAEPGSAIPSTELRASLQQHRDVRSKAR